MFSHKFVSTKNVLLLITSLFLVSLIINRRNAFNNTIARYRTEDVQYLRVIPPFESTTSIDGTHIKYGLLNIFIPDVLQAKHNEGIVISCKPSSDDRYMTDLLIGKIRLTCQLKSYFKPVFSSGKYSIANLYSKLQDFKARMHNFCVIFLPEPHATLLFGILFGNSTPFSPEFHESLVKSGVSHVVSASGYNVTWVSTLISVVLSRFLPKKTVYLFMIITIIVYATVSGFSPSVLRASVMGCISLFSKILKKKVNIYWLLTITILLLLLINPYMVYDVGFQLSVLSTMSIIFIYPFLRKHVFFSEKGIGYVKETALITFSVNLSTIPLIASVFGRISVISLFSNVVLLWSIPIIMVFGVIFLLFCIISRYIAVIMAYLLWVLLEFFVVIVRLSSSMTFSSLEVSKISLHIVIVCQFFLFAFVLGYDNCKKVINRYFFLKKIDKKHD